MARFVKIKTTTTTKKQTKTNKWKQYPNCKLEALYFPRKVLTWQVNSLVYHELLTEADVAEVLLALSDGGDLPTLVKHFPDDFLCGVLWQTPHKYCLTAGRALPCRGRRKVWGTIKGPVTWLYGHIIHSSPATLQFKEEKYWLLCQVWAIKKKKKQQHLNNNI